jgi:hypothetical protein
LRGNRHRKNSSNSTESNGTVNESKRRIEQIQQERQSRADISVTESAGRLALPLNSVNV